MVVKVECVEIVFCDENIDDIVCVLDVIMVVWGDFGVEIGDFEFIVVQKKLILCVKKFNCVVIIVM